MPIYTSVLKLDKPIGTPPHQVEVTVYSAHMVATSESVKWMFTMRMLPHSHPL